MNFWVFIKADKKGLNFFIAILLMLFIFNFILITAGGFPKGSLFLILGQLSIPSFFYLGFQGTSYFNYLQQQNFIKRNQQIIEHIEIKTVILFQKAFTIQPYKFNYPSKINVDPKKVSCQFISIKGETVLLCYVFDLGRFKRYLKPMHLSEDYGVTKIKHTQLILVNFTSKSNITSIEFIRGEYAISKIEY